MNKETIKKTYHLFVENLFEFTDEMISKLNNYNDEVYFDKFKVMILILFRLTLRR